MIRTFGLQPDYVLHDLSYANLILYGASQPTYHKRGERGEGEAGGKASAIGRDTEINGDDPANRQLIDALLG